MKPTDINHYFNAFISTEIFPYALGYMNDGVHLHKTNISWTKISYNQ